MNDTLKEACSVLELRNEYAIDFENSTEYLQYKFDVVRELLKTKESRFASLVYRNKEQELSLYLVHLNVNYRKVLARDLKVLLAQKVTNETEALALAELIASVRETLTTGKNSNYTKSEYYTALANNIKYHDNNLYVNCFIVSKKVLEAVVYKEVKSSAKTIAKNHFRKMLKMSKFREFCIDLNQIHEIRMNAKTLIVA